MLTQKYTIIWGVWLGKKTLLFSIKVQTSYLCLNSLLNENEKSGRNSALCHLNKNILWYLLSNFTSYSFIPSLIFHYALLDLLGLKN